MLGLVCVFGRMLEPRVMLAFLREPLTLNTTFNCFMSVFRMLVEYR